MQRTAKIHARLIGLVLLIASITHAATAAPITGSAPTTFSTASQALNQAGTVIGGDASGGISSATAVTVAGQSVTFNPGPRRAVGVANRTGQKDCAEVQAP